MNLKRRVCPRIVENLPVDIENSLGEKVHAQTLNLSVKGIGLRCTTDDRNLITPQGDVVSQGRPVEVEMQLTVTNAQGKPDIIKANCGITYSRRLAQGECQVGMVFLDMDDVSEDNLKKFINKSLDQS